MIVDPDFPNHWKTLMLAEMIGGEDVAIATLIRLWGHCQNRRMSTFDKLPSIALKAICKYQGDAGVLEAALVDSGYIERLDDGSLLVCGWDEYNASLIGSWRNGKKGGRPKKSKPSESPKETQPKPSRNPVKTQTKPSKNPVVNPMITDKIGEDKIGEDKIGEDKIGYEDNYAANVGSAAEAASVSQEDSAEAYLTRRKRKLTGQRLEDFERFWKVWSQGWIGKRDTGKAATADAWLDIPGYSPELVDTIITAAAKEAQARPALIARGQSPKWSQGWISERRWEVDEPEDTTPYRDIIAAYHDICSGLPKCTIATDERRAAIANLWRYCRHDIGKIKDYFRKVDQTGRLRRESWVNLDWLADPTNCAKIMDGNYDT